MKKIILVFGCSIFLLSFPGCNTKTGKETNGQTSPAEKREMIPVSGALKADSLLSKIEWTGYKPTGSHSGNIQLSSGEFRVNTGILTSGKFVLDMNSITCTDITDREDNRNLVEHLSDEDFFDVTKFPVASFEITEVIKGAEGTSNTVKGNLTIKGVTKLISFPAQISYADSKLTATALLKIDRTQFGIKYKSKTFFKELGNKFLNDEFDLKLVIVAHS